MENIRINADGTAEFVETDLAFLEKIKEEAKKAVLELVDLSDIRAGEILVVGCSTSEVTGNTIGKASIPPAAKALLDGILPVLREKGVFIAAQCCEHLNRAIILERACAEKYRLEIVSVRPQPKAGGAFATAVYDELDEPVAVETVKAHAGIDIGGTLIGMHLKSVAVPVRLSLSKIGEANILAARTRPKYIGGPRAEY